MKYYMHMIIHHTHYNFELNDINGYRLMLLDQYLGETTMVIKGEPYLLDANICNYNDLIELLEEENKDTKYMHDEEIQEIMDWLKKTNY